MHLSDKNILLCITGCIAAYKAGYLLRALMREGANVRVVMTKSACEFVAPLTFEALSGQPVQIEMFPEVRAGSVPHIELAGWADLILVAPATANIVGKFAAGVCDDLLSTILCAAQCQVILSPAMNSYMWENPITQYNLAKLSAIGHQIIDPDTGELATRDVGPGRFPEVEDIVRYVVRFFSRTRDFFGVKVLVTAGPTYEFIDPVRFIGNPSSGAMGYALAEAAVKRGAEVGLISGPSDLAAPSVSDFEEVVSTKQLADAVLARIDHYDILIMAAAPADYTPKEVHKHKIKKSAKPISIELEPTMDILKQVAASGSDLRVIGFALETQSEITNARKKMADKNLDMIVVNNPTVKGAGFGTTTNQVTIISRKAKPKKLPLMSKRELADEILDAVLKIR